MKCAGKSDVSKDLPPVAPSPRQPEGFRARMSLESNVIWTDRMLEALATGVKGKRWYSLMDKVWNPSHLRLGAWEVIRNEGGCAVSFDRLAEEFVS